MLLLGHNFCAEGPKCGENSECKNWNTKATCECKNGYISVQGDSAYCEGKEQNNSLWEMCSQFIWLKVLYEFGMMAYCIKQYQLARVLCSLGFIQAALLNMG